MVTYLLCLVLFSIGLFCAVRKRNIIKIIIGIGIMEYAVNLFLILIGYRIHGDSPIVARGQSAANIVDPLPQTVALTAIVISLAVMLMLVAVAIRIYDRYGTFDITKINSLKG